MLDSFQKPLRFSLFEERRMRAYRLSGVFLFQELFSNDYLFSNCSQ
jgi:hypothetical protein